MVSEQKRSEILGVIPARGGSKGIPKKNIVPLAGKPLIAWTIEEAQKSRYITRLVLTTDDPEIAAVGQTYGVEIPFMRPAELAGDLVTDLPVFQHCLETLRQVEGYWPDLVVHLRPTAPLRQVHHIDSAIELLLAHPEADAVRTIMATDAHPMKMWRQEDARLVPYIPEDVYGIQEAYNRPRQSLPVAYFQNASVDVVRAEVIVEQDSMTGRHILGLEMSKADSVDIDSRIDLELAAIILQNRIRS